MSENKDWTRPYANINQMKTGVSVFILNRLLSKDHYQREIPQTTQVSIQKENNLENIWNNQQNHR